MCMCDFNPPKMLLTVGITRIYHNMYGISENNLQINYVCKFFYGKRTVIDSYYSDHYENVLAINVL